MSNYERRRITKTTNTTTYTYTELNPNKVHHNKGALSKLKNKLNRKKKKTVTKTTKFQKAKPIHISKQNNINARPNTSLQSSQSLPIQNTCISPRLPQSYTNPTSPKSPPLTYSNHNHYNTYNNYNNNNNNLVRRSAPAIHLQKQLPQAQQPYIHPNNRFQNNNNNNNNNYQRNQSIYKQNPLPSNQYYNNNNYNQRPNNYNNNNNKNHVRHQSYSNSPSKPLPNKVKPLPNNANIIDRNHNYSNHYASYERPLPPKKYIPKSQFKQVENINNNNNSINVHDALLWNSYIDEYKCEPQKIETFLAFLKNTKDININYAKAKNIFINYKTKGKINVNINNKSLKIKQIKVIKKTDDKNDIKESKESYYESPKSKIHNSKPQIPIQPMSINSVNVNHNKDLKLWIDENYFSESLYNKLVNKHITFDTLKFIDINDLDPLCDELTLIISEKVRLKAAIKKLQNNNNKIYKNNNEKNEIIIFDDVKNEGLKDDEFVIEDDNEETAGGDNGMDTMNIHGENDENIEGDNNDNIVPFTNGFIEEDNNEMYLPGSYQDNNNNNNMDVGDMDNIDKLVLPGSYQDNDINDPGSYQDDNDNIDGGSLISEGVFYQMDNLGVNEVRDWLESIEMSMYYDLLLKHGFDSMKMIKLINSAKDLEDIGIKMKAHQLKIITAIQNV